MATRVLSSPGRIRLALARLARSSVVAQTAALTSAGALASLLGLVVTPLLARQLSPTSYGSYSFAGSALPFVAMLFEFGLFLPASRLAAKSEEPARREIVGTVLVVYLPIGLAFGVTVYLLSFGVDHWFHVRAAVALRLITPLALAYPFQFVAYQLAQGLGRLRAFSVATVLSRSCFTATLVALVLLDVQLDVPHVLLLEAFTLSLAWIWLIIRLQPALRSFRTQASILVREARAYGFQIYIGRVLSMGTYNMDVLMVAALTDARTVGFYTLAGAMAYPIGLPVSGLAAALFAGMARDGRLNRRLLSAAWGIGLGIAALACLLAGPVVRIGLGARYLPAVGLLPPLALAQVVRAVTALYNSFLAARAHGAEIRNAALLLTGSNLVLNVLLIPPFGAIGAAWASLLALVANLVTHIAFYRRVLGPLEEVPVRW